MRTVTYDEILSDLGNCGISAGDTLLVHSAMTPIGYVEGGAETVARALREAVGAEGTLVAPVFCFSHEIQDPPVIDPENDPSETGQISEAIRKLPGAKRSIAYRHSFAAVGRHADEIVDVDPSLSVFDIESSFGRMLALDTKVMLLGVTWLNSTTHHFSEYLLQVKDRHTVERKALLRQKDGSLVPITLTDYQPKPTETGEYYSYPHDFNRAGRMLEEQGKVVIKPVGNALARVHRMRDLVHFFLDNYSLMYNMFAVDGTTHSRTQLPDGRIVTKQYLDGAGRDDLAEWSCVNEADIFRR